MKLVLSRRLTLLLWLLIPAAALGLYFIPLSNRFTKICTLMIVLVMWRGLLALMWPHRRLRWVVPGLTLLAAGFLLLPGRAGVNDDAVRASYIHSLKSYEGSLYYWGGESRRGIDCSGLIRCGMMNGLAKTGLRSADPGLVRQSLSLWWNDASARDLGKEHRGLTKLLFQARSINEADHSRLLPGDIAVTTNGVHILAYLADGNWIQASPGAGRVVISKVPVENDAWFQQPVNLLRWTVLTEQ
jgi:cell wall-associated NlpC family hydrolase